MTALLADLRFALRLLAKAPGFAAAAILSLALGIGANATVYTWSRNLLQDPLPAVPRSGELLVLASADPGSPAIDVSFPDFDDVARESRTLEAVSASRWTTLNLGEGDEVERIYGQVVSGGFFRMLGLRPALGRLLEEGDDLEGGPQLLVISHGFWQRRFGGRADVLGRTVKLGGLTRTIVGVAPEAFGGSIGGLSFDAWLPVRPHYKVMGAGSVLTSRRNRCFYVMARPKPGETLAQVQGELSSLARELERRHPDENRGIRMNALALSRSHQGVQSLAGQPLAVLGFAVGLVFLIACANVANLIMARAAGRERELAIRQALGAGRRRLLAQLLTESLLLGLAGGAAGYVLSLWSSGALRYLAPPTYLPLVLRTAPDASAAAFSVGLSLLAGLVFGIIPALRGTTPDLPGALKEGSRGSGGPRLRRLQGALVVAELGLAVMLLVGAGLLLKSLQSTRNSDPGFNPRGVAVAGYGLENTAYDQEKTAQVGRAFLEGVRALPGVQGAAMSQELVMGLEGSSWDYVRIEGREEGPGARLRVNRNIVTPGWFATLGLPLRAGRDFTEADRAGSLGVVVVNEAMARTYWPGQDPLGRRLFTGDTPWTVVGVCGSTRGRTWTAPVAPFMFFPSAQSGDDGCHVLYVRSGEPLPGLQARLKAVLRGVDRDLPLVMDSLERIVDSSAWNIALAAKVLGALGLLALVLAAVGIYGVMATSVSHRVPEFGIRMSLGADSRRILALVLGQGGTLVALGLAAGLAGAAALSRFLAHLLLGVDAVDAAVFLGVPALLSAIALCACAIPALRATRIDPNQALRQE